MDTQKKRLRLAERLEHLQAVIDGIAPVPDVSATEVVLIDPDGDGYESNRQVYVEQLRREISARERQLK